MQASNATYTNSFASGTVPMELTEAWQPLEIMLPSVAYPESIIQAFAFDLTVAPSTDTVAETTLYVDDIVYE